MYHTALSTVLQFTVIYYDTVWQLVEQQGVHDSLEATCFTSLGAVKVTAFLHISLHKMHIYIYIYIHLFIYFYLSIYLFTYLYTHRQIPR